VDGGIGPLGLVGPWIGYRVFKKKKSALKILVKESINRFVLKIRFYFCLGKNYTIF